MNFKIHFFSSFFFLFCNADAFNITSLLNQYSAYSTFNNYLTQTQLAGVINSRQTITVLAVNNDNISPLSGKSATVLKAIMSVHIILDYYDIKKLQALPNKTTTLTTLYQSSGNAKGQQGFLNATVQSGGSVSFGSAVPGSSIRANYVAPVASQPYNISVLQVSTVIVPPGLDNMTNSSPPNGAPSPTPGPPSPAPESPKSPPRHSSPPKPDDAPTESPADGPTADDSLA